MGTEFISDNKTLSCWLSARYIKFHVEHERKSKPHVIYSTLSSLFTHLILSVCAVFTGGAVSLCCSVAYSLRLFACAYLFRPLRGLCLLRCIGFAFCSTLWAVAGLFASNPRALRCGFFASIPTAFLLPLRMAFKNRKGSQDMLFARNFMHLVHGAGYTSINHFRNDCAAKVGYWFRVTTLEVLWSGGVHPVTIDTVEATALLFGVSASSLLFDDLTISRSSFF